MIKKSVFATSSYGKRRKKRKNYRRISFKSDALWMAWTKNASVIVIFSRIYLAMTLQKPPYQVNNFYTKNHLIVAKTGKNIIKLNERFLRLINQFFSRQAPPGHHSGTAWAPLEHLLGTEFLWLDDHEKQLHFLRAIIQSFVVYSCIRLWIIKWFFRIIMSLMRKYDSERLLVIFLLPVAIVCKSNILRKIIWQICH